jgi:hypothetical protein
MGREECWQLIPCKSITHIQFHQVSRVFSSLVKLIENIHNKKSHLKFRRFMIRKLSSCGYATQFFFDFGLILQIPLGSHHTSFWIFFFHLQYILLSENLSSDMRHLLKNYLFNFSGFSIDFSPPWQYFMKYRN